MTFLSKRKQILVSACLAAGFSNAFMLVPQQHVKVGPLELRNRHTPGHLQTRYTSFRPLQIFWGRQDPSTSSEESVGSKSSSSLPIQDFFSFDSSPGKQQEQYTGGRFSLILSQAENVIKPAADALDEATDGWALTYANLSPETESTPAGIAFLASNIAYAVAGVVLSLRGDLLLGVLIEIVSVGSFIYHYTQLDKESQDDTVRLALFMDYVLAFSSIFVGLGYLSADGQIPPTEGLISVALGGIFFLLGCTSCADGIPYMVVHSLWHVFSAYCSYIIGNMHLETMVS